MGQVLDKRATTTHAIRTAIQRSDATIQTLSQRYNIHPKTVLKCFQKKETGSQGTRLMNGFIAAASFFFQWKKECDRLMRSKSFLIFYSRGREMGGRMGESSWRKLKTLPPKFHSSKPPRGASGLASLWKRSALWPPVLTGAMRRKFLSHHRHKKDAPSGTAVALSEAIQESRPEALPPGFRQESGKLLESTAFPSWDLGRPSRFPIKRWDGTHSLQAPCRQPCGW